MTVAAQPDVAHWKDRDAAVGDIATWLAALGTTGAFGVSLFLLNAQRNQLRLARRDRKEREKDRRLEQARLVAAWCLAVATRQPGHEPSRQPEATHVVQVGYRNGSEEPVYGVQIVVKEDWGPSFEIEWRNIDVIPPNCTGQTEVIISLPEFGDDLPLPFPPVEIAFTDSAGRDWKRTDRGKLIEPKGERPPIRAWALAE